MHHSAGSDDRRKVKPMSGRIGGFGFKGEQEGKNRGAFNKWQEITKGRETFQYGTDVSQRKSLNLETGHNTTQFVNGSGNLRAKLRSTWFSAVGVSI